MLATSQYNLHVNHFLLVFKIYNLKNRKSIFFYWFLLPYKKKVDNSQKSDFVFLKFTFKTYSTVYEVTTEAG